MAKKKSSTGVLLYDNILDDLWKDKAMLQKMFCSKNVKKYNIDNFLMYRVATGGAKIVASNKNNKEDGRKDDCICW